MHAGIQREEHVAWRHTGCARQHTLKGLLTPNSKFFLIYKHVSIIFTHQLVRFVASSFSAINVKIINQLIKQFVKLSLILFAS